LKPLYEKLSTKIHKYDGDFIKDGGLQSQANYEITVMNYDNDDMGKTIFRWFCFVK